MIRILSRRCSNPGNMNIVINKEIRVPIPRNNPIVDITDDLEINPIRNPAINNINPLVMTAGSESFNALIIASVLSCLVRSCLYLEAITIA